MTTVLTALGVESVAPDIDGLVAQFEIALRTADPSTVWLALAVLDARLPRADDVRRTVRTIRLDGVSAAFGSPVGRAVDDWLGSARDTVDVEVMVGDVLVDLEHTARADVATGIQRVARETSKRWVRDHDVRLVAWSPDHSHLRLLGPDEQERALTGSPARSSNGHERGTVIVPWRSTYLLPELSPERERNERIAAIAQFARGRSGVIGFDCVPITTAETTALGVSEAFASNLAAVRHMDNVSAISQAAALEYRGWRSMLSSIGQRGPEITPDLLPAEAPATTDVDLAAVRASLTVPGLPMVLCVGTHEPRKNHVALLHAAELLWRDGVQFSLVLVGGRSWNDDAFQSAVATARGRNRPLDVVTTMSDDVLWAAYRVARCVVFPSLNEGFGLPIAESLACGTPIVTSRYGSMAEIGAAGGAVLVDPRDDADIARGLRAVIEDDALHSSLVAQALARPSRTWDDYAAAAWSTLAVRGSGPTGA
ncbi:glycosyltransferase family 1 protein [Geodermatophilus sp. Leaf369]|uniref:glycosyltransferase family 4 protein n=1 Tax=Geodermatophilus sp. Leaf369 TaxID=1736354 RepID=UPI00138F86A0|nr:glycosyltransferase family 1 protein [Geodermatophilus sp. Leaf369]